MKIKIYKSQYVKNCCTEKSHAISYKGHDMVFLPKKLTEIKENRVYDNDNIHWKTYYNINFPDWIYEKLSDTKKLIIDLINKQWENELQGN